MSFSKRKKFKTILGLIVSVGFLALIFYNIDLNELIETFRAFDCSNLCIIVTIYALSLLCRAIRWKFLLRGDAKYSLYQLGSCWVIGNLMNAFLPARAGDIWRSFAIGAKGKESKMKIFGSVMLERILDGVCICIFLYMCILMYSNLIWVRQFANLSMLLFGGSLLFFWYIVRFNKINSFCAPIVKLSAFAPIKIREFIVRFIKKICGLFASFVNGFEVMRSGYYSALSIVFSFSAWALECLMAHYIITSFGIQCGFSGAVFVICFIALSAMIPSSSIFVGPYQYAYILAMGIFFVPKSEALAVALVHQAIFMVSLIVFSAIFVLINFARESFITSNQKSIEEKEEIGVS